MKKKKPKKAVGYGYVGTWSNGNLGWLLPKFIGQTGDVAKPLKKDIDGWLNKNSLFYKCKITITPIKRKGGGYVSRKAKVFLK